MPDSSYPPPSTLGYFAAMWFAFMGLSLGYPCKILNSGKLAAKYRLETTCALRSGLVFPLVILSLLILSSYFLCLNEKAAKHALAAFFCCFKYSESSGCKVPRESPCLPRRFAGLGLDSDFCPRCFVGTGSTAQKMRIMELP